MHPHQVAEVLKRHALARGEFLGRTLELPAGREDIAPARRAHRRRVAGVEDVFGELLDLLPVRAFVSGAWPRIEWNEIDLRWYAFEEPNQRFGVLD